MDGLGHRAPGALDEIVAVENEGDRDALAGGEDAEERRECAREFQRPGRSHALRSFDPHGITKTLSFIGGRYWIEGSNQWPLPCERQAISRAY